MDRIKSAAIILIGLGEKYSSEILKNMNPKEVKVILEAINTIEDVNEVDIMQAMDHFFQDTNNALSIDSTSKEQIKNSLMNSIGNRGLGEFINSVDIEKQSWFKLFEAQSPNHIYDMIQDEHPQVIAAITIIIFNFLSTDHGIKFTKLLPQDIKSQVFRRMTSMGFLSQICLNILAIFFEAEIKSREKNNIIALNGVEAVANIISYLDSETEHAIMDDLTSRDKSIGDEIQDKIFPFSKLADLDKKSLQTLLKEVKNDDLILALKGVDEHVKDVFMQNMSQKSAEILKDEMESKGPVKLTTVVDAQKRIIRIAKDLEKEEKIIISGKNSGDIVF